MFAAEVMSGSWASSEFTVIRSVVDELTDAGVKVKPAVTLIRHTGAPKSDGKFKLMLTENAADSFNDAEIELTFSGIPDEDDVEITLDAWVITKDDLDDGETQVFGDEPTILRRRHKHGRGHAERGRVRDDSDTRDATL